MKITAKKVLVMILAVLLIFYCACEVQPAEDETTPTPTEAITPTEAEAPSDDPDDSSFDVLDKTDFTVVKVKLADGTEKEISRVEYNYYFLMKYQNFINTYGSYLSLLGFDTSKTLKEQVYDPETGATWFDHFCLEAEAMLNEIYVFERESELRNIEMAADLAANIEEYFTAMQSYTAFYDTDIDGLMKMLYGSAASAEKIREVMTRYYKAANAADVIFKSYVYPDDEIEAFYNENKDDFADMEYRTVNVRHILVDTKEEADAIFADWQAGEATAKSFAALAGEHSTDGGSSSNGGLYEGVYKGQMVEPFENWCFDESRVEGDSGIVETDYGYHIMYFDSFGEYYWKISVKTAMADAEFAEMYNEAAKNFTFTVDESSIEKLNKELEVLIAASSAG